VRKRSIFCVILLMMTLTAGSAAAYTFDLKYEFDGDLPVLTYGTVDVTQSGDDLLFIITVDTTTVLGTNADIHELYFNLTFTPTNLAITADNHPNNAYTLLGPNPSVTGGAGASFDWGVSFGNGGGPAGNGTLQYASLTLSADEALSVSNLFELSYPNGIPPVNVAVHFQGTATSPGSETIGGYYEVPLPGAMWLFGSGLMGLAGLRRKFMA